MNSENIILEKVDGLYDIQPLIPPSFSAVEIFLIVLIFLIFTAYIIWRIFYSRKGRAKREIKKLQHLYQDKKINAHDTAYQLCLYLQDGLNLKQLKIDTAIPAKIINYKNKWSDFTQKISKLRYEKNDHDKSELDKVFIDSLFWLKVWP